GWVGEERIDYQEEGHTSSEVHDERRNRPLQVRHLEGPRQVSKVGRESRLRLGGGSRGASRLGALRGNSARKGAGRDCKSKLTGRCETLGREWAAGMIRGGSSRNDGGIGWET